MYSVASIALIICIPLVAEGIVKVVSIRTPDALAVVVASGVIELSR